MAWKRSAAEAGERRDPMQEAADRIIAEIEKGVIPWHREWDPTKCSGPQGPFNGATGHRYSGINVIQLGFDKRAFVTNDPRWCSYQQAAEKGWQVRKGEKSTTIFFTKSFDVDDKEHEDEKTTIRIYRSYSVFHFSQMDGVPPYVPPTQEEAPWTRPDAAQIILDNCGAAFRVGGDRAFYAPELDLISMPPDAAFSDPAYWSATLIHEVNHSTGHPSRMKRDMSGKFGSEIYAIEESRVDMAAAFVCNALGLPTDYANHAAYIDHWLKKVKADKRELFRYAAEAQRIADFTLSYHPDWKSQIEPQPDRPRSQPDQPERRPEA